MRQYNYEVPTIGTYITAHSFKKNIHVYSTVHWGNITLLLTAEITPFRLKATCYNLHNCIVYEVIVEFMFMKYSESKLS